MIVGWCVDLFNAGAEAWLGYTLFQTSSCRRFHGKWAIWAEYAAFLALPAASIMANRVLNIRFSNIQTISLVMIFFLAAMIFTKKNILCALAWPAVYSGTVSLLELPGIVLSGWITGEPFIECIHEPVAVDYIYLALLWARLLFLERKWGVKARSYIQQVIVAKNGPFMDRFWRDPVVDLYLFSKAWVSGKYPGRAVLQYFVHCADPCPCSCVCRLYYFPPGRDLPAAKAAGGKAAGASL